MNYKAELRGFALDRAIRMKEVGAATCESIIEQADKIVDYIYIADKDIKSHIDTLVPLIVQSGDIEKLDTFILELQQIRAEMATKEKRASNENDSIN